MTPDPPPTRPRFRFTLQELGGSLGDLGTLLPLAVGYICICGMDPAGLLIMLGLANIATGLIYRLPLPIEPMKVIAVIAIAQRWSPEMIYAAGLGMGITWTVLALTGTIDWIARHTPLAVIRGIQVALGLLLMREACRLMLPAWGLGLAAIVIVLVLRTNRYAPAAVVLVALGTALMAWTGDLFAIAAPALSLPSLQTFDPAHIWTAMVGAGFAQIPLTATNAVIATVALLASYWPGCRVTHRQLSLNMGIMNLVFPFFGGMPLCHGAGGLAGQYFFGARSGGANIIEGTIEICLGLFLAASITTLFTAFPAAIIGGMMFMVGIELLKFAADRRWNRELPAFILTVIVSLASNMAWGFLAGLGLHLLLGRLHRSHAA